MAIERGATASSASKQGLSTEVAGFEALRESARKVEPTTGFEPVTYGLRTVALPTELVGAEPERGQHAIRARCCKHSGTGAAQRAGGTKGELRRRPDFIARGLSSYVPFRFSGRNMADQQQISEN